MNKDRVLQLARHLATVSPENYDMNMPNMCVIGHAEHLFGVHGRVDIAQYMDLPFDTVNDIYFGRNDKDDQQRFDRSQKDAILMLNNLAETGVVDWNVKDKKLERLLTAVSESLTAWDGEEDSVKEEHADMIKELQDAFDAYQAAN
jgi:hypothetical protein